MEFRQETGAGAVSVPNIVTCSSPWGQTAPSRLKARARSRADQSLVSKGCTEMEPSCSASASSSRPAGPADAIDLRACFSAVDCSSTARSWGWNRSTTSRRVKAWVASGQLVRTPGPDGRSVFTARTPDVPQACDAAAPSLPRQRNLLVIPTVSLPVQSAAQGERPVIGIVQHFGSGRESGSTPHERRRHVSHPHRQARFSLVKNRIRRCSAKHVPRIASRAARFPETDGQRYSIKADQPNLRAQQRHRAPPTSANPQPRDQTSIARGGPPTQPHARSFTGGFRIRPRYKPN